MSAQDPFSGYSQSGGVHTLAEPITNGVAVTPDDANDLTTLPRAVFVGGTGDLKVNLPNGSGLTFKAVPAGTWLWIRAARILATGTTATSILALW